MGAGVPPGPPTTQRRRRLRQLPRFRRRLEPGSRGLRRSGLPPARRDQGDVRPGQRLPPQQEHPPRPTLRVTGPPVDRQSRVVGKQQLALVHPGSRRLAFSSAEKRKRWILGAPRISTWKRERRLILSTMTTRIGTREEWLAAREQLLVREKEHTRLGDELARQRRELPWVRVEQDYRFETDDGEKGLAELFDGRSQLLVYHFMFGSGYQAGCPVNSSIADTVDGVLPHLHARDATFLLVSQAPLQKLQAYKRRMGWSIPWVSASPSDFNFDLGFSHTEEEGREVVAQMMGSGAIPPIVEQNDRASGTDPAGYMTESPGFSTFVRDEDAVYHTYSTTWRGLEFVMGYYPILDHAPKGRDEGEAWQLWLRRHDEYESE